MDTAALKVKICGNRTAADIELAAGAGADFAGVIVDVPQSPRSVPLETARELSRSPAAPLVAVLLDPFAESAWTAADALRPAAIQLHGAEPPELVAALKAKVPCEVWKVVHLRPAGTCAETASTALTRVRAYIDAGADVLLLDTALGASRAGGTGVRSDWRLAAELIAAFLPGSGVVSCGGVLPRTPFEIAATLIK